MPTTDARFVSPRFIEKPLPPAALSLAVATWYAGKSSNSKSLTFHVWEHLLAAGVLVIEPDEDDQNITHTIYRLDVTPLDEGEAPSC